MSGYKDISEGVLTKKLSKLSSASTHERKLTKKAPELLPSKYFRQELEREVLRSDRTGLPLTVLVFDVHNSFRHPKGKERELGRLGKVVSDCARRIDSKGWYADNDGLRVSLLLHHTRPQNSHRVINEVRRRFREVTADKEIAAPIDITCEMFAYACDKENGQVKQGKWQRMDSDKAKGDALLKCVAPGVTPFTKGEHAFYAPTGPGGVPIAPLSQPAESLLSQPLPLWKRTLDICGVLFGLIVLSPLLIFIGLAIKLTSPGPIFYKQQRVGYQGKLFTFWKFRSMRVSHDSSKHKEHLKQLIRSDEEENMNGTEPKMNKLDNVNPDITFIGRILRKSSLDELPQLINVLKGEMSMVGPRPCLPYELEEYRRWNKRRFDIIPGMTGMWQVNGKNELTFKQMIRLDITYIRNCSLLLDLKIILKTFPTIFHDVTEALTRRKAIRTTNSMEV